MLLLSAVPFVIASFYTLPVNDDFSNAIIWKGVSSGKEYWEIAFGEMNNIYMTWQGTYTGNLILYSLGVFYRWGVSGIRVFAFINIALFLGALFYLTYIVMKYMFKIEAWVSAGIAYGVLCICFFWTRIHSEFFYFHTASCMYTIPLALGAVSIGMAVKVVLGEKRNFGNKIGSVVFGILGCGGTLQIPAAICFVYLLLLIWSFFYKRDRFKEVILIFILVLAGALGNALAPGNFIRQERMTCTKGGGFHLFQAVKYSLYMSIQEMYYILTKTYFLFVFWIAFFCFYDKVPTYKINTFNGPGGILLTTIIGSAITNFPIALGRASTYMDNRGYSTLDLFLIIGLLFFLYALINYSKNKFKVIFGSKEKVILIMCISIGFISCQGHMNLFKTPSFLCMEELKENTIQQSAEEWMRIFEYLENCQESEVVLPYPSYSQDIILNVVMEDWPEYWVNQDLAQYFQKTAIYYSDLAEPLKE